jgi:hypothetical protein
MLNYFEAKTSPPPHPDHPTSSERLAMDRKLARRNLRTAFYASIVALLMFALTFVAALVYVQ